MYSGNILDKLTIDFLEKFQLSFDPKESPLRCSKNVANEHMTSSINTIHTEKSF